MVGIVGYFSPGIKRLGNEKKKKKYFSTWYSRRAAIRNLLQWSMSRSGSWNMLLVSGLGSRAAAETVAMYYAVCGWSCSSQVGFMHRLRSRIYLGLFVGVDRFVDSSSLSAGLRRVFLYLVWRITVTSVARMGASDTIPTKLCHADLSTLSWKKRSQEKEKEK